MSFFPVGAHVVDTRTHLHSLVMGCSIESLRVSSQVVILKEFLLYRQQLFFMKEVSV